jgi:uncharacterized membrane protein
MSKNPYDVNSDPYDYDYQPFGSGGRVSNLDQPFPTGTMSSSGTLDEEEMRLKQMDLQKREEELARREREIQLKEGVISSVQKKNWPICKPFLYHSIKDEIQPGLKQKTAYVAYFTWMALSFAFLLNFALAFVTIFVPAEGTNGIPNTLDKVKFVLFAGILFAIGPMTHFAICYWPLYKALSTLTIGRFTLFFIGYAVAILFTLFCVAGWYDYGACGIVLAIMYFPTGSSSGLAFGLNLMMAVIWAIFALIFIIIYIICIRVARQENHTFAKAVQFTRGAVVSTVGSAAASAVVSSATTGSHEQV